MKRSSADFFFYSDCKSNACLFFHFYSFFFFANELLKYKKKSHLGGGLNPRLSICGLGISHDNQILFQAALPTTIYYKKTEENWKYFFS